LGSEISGASSVGWPRVHPPWPQRTHARGSALLIKGGSELAKLDVGEFRDGLHQLVLIDRAGAMGEHGLAQAAIDPVGAQLRESSRSKPVGAGVVKNFALSAYAALIPSRPSKKTVALKLTDDMIHWEVETRTEVLARASMLKVDGPKATIEINRYAARLFGQGEHKGLSALTAQYRMFDGDRELMPDEQPLQRAARSGESVPDFEGRIVRADGGSVHVIMAATPLFDEQAVPRGAIASMLDISQRKRGERR
jgi:PAS domain S-box-containing protein